jgi:hypothetical protein
VYIRFFSYVYPDRFFYKIAQIDEKIHVFLQSEKAGCSRKGSILPYSSQPFFDMISPRNGKILNRNGTRSKRGDYFG